MTSKRELKVRLAERLRESEHLQDLAEQQLELMRRRLVRAERDRDRFAASARHRGRKLMALHGGGE